jgi:hypothetical protein
MVAVAVLDGVSVAPAVAVAVRVPVPTTRLGAIARTASPGEL